MSLVSTHSYYILWSHAFIFDSFLIFLVADPTDADLMNCIQECLVESAKPGSRLQKCGGAKALKSVGTAASILRSAADIYGAVKLQTEDGEVDDGSFALGWCALQCMGFD